jgi:hypothetical protein
MSLSGDTVTYPKAVQEIKDFLLVHDKLKDSLDAYLPNPTPGSNLEKMKQFFMSDRLSFAFKKEHIEELFSIYTDANAIRIYLGLNSDGSTPEPTIVITACAVSQNGAGDIITALTKQALRILSRKTISKINKSKVGYNQTNFDLLGDTL